MDKLDPNNYYLNFRIKWGIESYHFDLKFNIQVFGFALHKLYLRNRELCAPKTLYKYYRPTSYNLESLREKYLYFTDPLKFNDPFDCISQKENDSKFRNNQYSIYRENLGVCCFSTVKNNLQMWAFYTDSYRGFCVKFNNDDQFMPYQKSLNIKSHVLYLKNLLIDHPNFLETVGGIDKYISDKDYAEWIKQFVTYYYQYCCKANSWSYENEYRLISLFAQMCDRKMSFFPSNIHEIYIGYNMEETYLNLLMNILRSDYPHVKIYKVIPNISKVKLDFKKVH